MKFRVIFIALLCTIAIGMLHHLITEHLQKPDVPEKVTLYLEEESRICTLPLKDYIVGRLLAECPEPLEEEAMKAAACAISSTALYRIEGGEKPMLGAQLSDGADGYLSPAAALSEYGEEYSSLLPLYEAAAEYGVTHVATYESKPIYAPICRLSAGVTDKGEHPWLTPTAAERDFSSDEHLASSAFNTEQVRLALRGLCPDAHLTSDSGAWFTDALYLESGTLQSVKFGGHKISGAELCDALGLRSSAITIEYAEERFVFTTKGIGKNLGMSLFSADKMALLGSSAEDILEHFYSGAEVVEL